MDTYGLLFQVFTFGFILFEEFTHAEVPTNVCNFTLYGYKLADSESSCHYYFCNGFGEEWQRRKCKYSGAVPKYYRRRYRFLETRINLCRTYSKECTEKVEDLKKITTQKIVPPTTPPCIPLGGKCTYGTKCCPSSEIDVDIICNYDEGICEERCREEGESCSGSGDCCPGGNLICDGGTCKPIDCEYPMAPDHGSIETRSTPANDVGRLRVGGIVHFDCDPCYEIVPDDEGNVDDNLRCQPDGTWDGPEPTCREKECTTLPAPQDGSRDPPNGPDKCGDTVTVDCDDGFKPSGTLVREVTCIDSGRGARWDKTPMTCNPNCEYPTAPENGFIVAGTSAGPNSQGRLDVGGTVRFDCDPCYTLTPDGSGRVDNDLTCQSDGTWDDDIPTCTELQCDVIEAPANGKRTPSNGPDKCGETVTFECDEGFEPAGTKVDTVNCVQDGNSADWDEEPMTCEGGTCVSLRGECQEGVRGKECCAEEILTCSLEKVCCRDRSGDCRNDGDCCRGLTCSSLGTCEPPISIKCVDPQDIMFAVDTSCSIAEADKDRIRTFMTEMARAFELSNAPDNGIQMGAVTFNDNYQHVAYLKDAKDPERLIKRIETMSLVEEGCRTHTFAALKAMEDIYFTPAQGKRAGVVSKLILLSDGVTKPSNKQKNTFQNADSLRELGVEIIVVGLPQGCDAKAKNCEPKVIGEEEWMGISGADEDPNLLFNVLNTDFTKLRETIQNIGVSICGEGSVTIN
ncbi:unnamed protein product [Owenia fusiformis]|uniref:Uncharacterized protein n=1 Tax=Owenia fusiformis TaxID=6347 RepID=A0A8S4N1B4_OWEFU|nr:unnamed protein product [Owenia fusiformis]